MAITLNGTTGISSPAINAGNIVGQVCFFAMSTAPTGFLKCNGATISRTTYADLFAVIGTTYGSGDGSTTFTLPDLRGEFLRSLDDGRGVDSGRAIGSTQADVTKEENLRSIGGANVGGKTFTAVGVADPSYNQADENNTYLIRSSFALNKTIGDSSYRQYLKSGSGAETRPRNVALLACIKF